MIDSEYFRRGLQADVDALGGEAIVELHLLNGRSQRLRSVVSIQQGHVTLEAYRNQGVELSTAAWQGADGDGPTPHETERVAAGYEAIASVQITPTRRGGPPKVGFGGP